MKRLLPVVVLVFAACGGEVDSSSDPAVRSDALTGTWQTGGNVGNGVSMMDTGNPLGANVFIGYAGYNINLGESQAWVGALYDTRLRELGVRYLFAVQGPADSGYNGLEIGNSRIAAALASLWRPEMGFIIVAGHSSGSFVADELLQQMDTGADPYGVLGARMIYFDLDGDQKYVGPNAINRLRRAYYVNGFNPATGAASWNHGAMVSLGNAFAGKGGWFQYDAASSGCSAGGCVHISLINTVPHNPGGGSGVDYRDFGGRPVNTWWLDVKREEAGLGQCASPFTTEGLIQERYAAMGGCESNLGSPTTNMLVTLDGNGRFNNFTWGAIYWSFFTGAHEVRGAIHAAWAALNYENGFLGYPISDELVTADTLGRYNRFQHGAVYWSYGTGAHGVIEPVYSAWAAANFENGALGYPIGDTHFVTGGVANEFQHGTLTVFTDGTSRIDLAGVDAGTPPVVVDAGQPAVEVDAGQPSIEVDAGQPEVDAGVAPVDAGFAPISQPVVTPDPELVIGGCSAVGGNQWAGLSLVLLALCRRKQGRAPDARP